MHNIYIYTYMHLSLSIYIYSEKCARLFKTCYLSSYNFSCSSSLRAADPLVFVGVRVRPLSKLRSPKASDRNLKNLFYTIVFPNLKPRNLNQEVLQTNRSFWVNASPRAERR